MVSLFLILMMGYPESLTDPSYSGQILVITYPLVWEITEWQNLIKITWTWPFESDRIHIKGLIFQSTQRKIVITLQ